MSLRMGSASLFFVLVLLPGAVVVEVQALDSLRGGSQAVRSQRLDPMLNKDNRCVAVMRETQQACQGIPAGESNFDCNYAVCTHAESYVEDCGDIKTTRKGGVVFKDDLQKIKMVRSIVCDDIRHAGDDCEKDLVGEVTQRFQDIADSATALPQIAKRRC